ncbi:hypothetical protein [Clostridium baratii]|uniref:Uncharacterized protein n=1 Tax=Clostridium baratii TaxID=1561 RepID=A0A174R1Q8_9CLOT|nr:hypothetical protein [Clostridium baratii]CUP79392.1 Uncharacterised protein [Clostridium baratii]
MRKYWLTLMIVIFLFISIGINVNYILKQNDKKSHFLAQVYGGLKNIKILLDPETKYENIESIKDAKSEIQRLCDAIFYYYSYVDDNLYWNKMYFNQLVFTLSSESGNLDGLHISGILEDGIISDTEKNYLKALYNDFNLLINKMKEKNSTQVDLSTSIEQINKYFNTFFSKWNTRSADTPFKMLTN